MCIIRSMSLHHHIDPNDVFANNYLNFEDIKVVGFDMDYTLVQYTTELQNLIYTLARDMLTSVYGYPASLNSCVFDRNFAIRGLSIDKRNGNVNDNCIFNIAVHVIIRCDICLGVLCKVSQMQRVNLHGVFKGKRPLRESEIESLYGNELVELCNS